MRKLEHLVAPILGPMVKYGRPTRLSPHAQQTVATWAVKTACVLQRLYPTDEVIPQSEYQRFYIEQRPLPKQVVWIGNRLNVGSNLFTSKWKVIRRMTTDQTVSADSIQEQIMRGSRMYRVVFSLGQVAFAVFGHTFDGGMNFAMAPVKVIQQVWPVCPRFKWPPPTSIDAIGGIEALHDGFDPPYESLIERGLINYPKSERN